MVVTKEHAAEAVDAFEPLREALFHLASNVGKVIRMRFSFGGGTCNPVE